jgi:3-deoxy-D-manno-octulosonic-acid transferase
LSVWRHSVAAVSALVGAPVLLGAAAVSPRWRVGLRERLGAGATEPDHPLWVHAASVGEILAASRLVDALQAKGHAVVTSTSTATGRDVMAAARPLLSCRLAPLDHPWCVDAALARVSPRALVLIETELWPVWIAAAARRGIPVVLVSGRLSDRSFPRYRRLAPLLARTLARLAAVGARTERDRERFVALGALPERVSVVGDLKLEPDPAPRPLAPDLAAAIGEVPLLVAGSTHPGEEAAALAALAAVESAGHPAALLLAPRHLDRTDEVAAAVRASGRRLVLRSGLPAAPLARGDVLVLDSLGELAAVYARAAAAFVGGTLAPVGGHNVLEPAAARRPVVFGPSTQNVRHAVELLLEGGGGIQIGDANGLEDAFAALLRDPRAADATGLAGWQALQRHRGSAERSAQLVLSVLGAR